ncbi:ATPase, T2SS/T4P/T4SS family [Desulfococcaceae bacterium HSG7]|nr:ATPase, T2SS/T4P/T4SS family [Desulfococcaceae bacterium HSG7]
MNGTIISLYSSKGGVGKTFIAANLAVAIRLNAKKRVLLLDFGLPFSYDIARMLNMKNLKPVQNILPSVPALHEAIIQSFIASHDSGISVLSLSGGDNRSVYKHLVPKSIETLINKLRQSYHIIIIDLGMQYCPVAAKILDLATLNLIPVTPDYLSVQQAGNDLVFLRTLNFAKKKIKLVANMVGLNDYITPRIIEQRLTKEIIAEFPYDPDVISRLTEGTYPQAHPRHPLTKSLDKLAFYIVEESGRSQEMNSSDDRHEVALTPADIANWNQLKLSVLNTLLESIDFKKLDTDVENDPQKMAELENSVIKKITEVIDAETDITAKDVRDMLLKEVLQEALRLGPLEDLLADPEVSEIMVNRWDQIYVERNGNLTMTERKFLSEQHLMRIIGRIVAPIGRKVDTSTPMVDARLKDGSRVNAIIPPLSINGASLTIRKFPAERMTIKDLTEKYNSLNEQIASFLEAAVVAKMNILVSGGTGTGKTTLLNILSAFIPVNERIITVEDSAELQMQQPHVITLEARPPNIEGKGEITIRDLVKNTLRMRPDRIVVGECRGAEALDMLQAMNTGHDGSLTTIHANSARESLSRLETLVLFTGYDLPSKAIKEQIVGAIDLVAQISRFKDGSRKITQVAEVTGMEGSVITMGDIFEYKQAGEEEGMLKGDFYSTGYIPKCLERFAEKGITIPREIFWASK